MAETSRTTPGAVAAVVAVVGVLAAGVAVGLWALSEPEGFIVGLRPLDEQRAVVLMRTNEDDTSRAWIGVVTQSKELLWYEELPGLTYGIDSGHGLTHHEDRITVKVTDGESLQILAYDARSGDRLWETPRTPFDDSYQSIGAPFFYGLTPQDDGELLLHGDHDGAEGAIVARDPSTGQRLWSHPVVGATARSFAVTPGAVLYRESLAWTALSRDGGDTMHKMPVYSDACIDEQQWVGWGRSKEREAMIVRWAYETGETTKTPTDLRPVTLTCGRYGDALIFGALTTNDDKTASFSLVAKKGDPPTTTWTINLGPFEPAGIARSRDSHGADAHPLRGDMTRFVPLVVGHRTDATQFKLVVVDLAEGVVSWESEVARELLHYYAFRTPSGDYLLSHFGRLVAIDGTTGAVTGAVVVDGSLDEVRPFCAVGDVVWVYNKSWANMDELPWLILDAKTLEVRASGSPRDVRPLRPAWLPNVASDG